MDLIKHRFLLVPLLVILIAFALDKLILLENVHTYFSKTLSDINYLQKDGLFEDLKEYLKTPERKKVLVYFGNSRALLFDQDYIGKKYPDWILYNFSVPGGKADYTLQWMEKFARDEVKPDFFLFDHSLELYNSSATLKVDETLTNGLNLLFVLRHFSLFSTDDISTLIAKRLFRSYQFRPKIEVILRRAREKKIYLYPYRELRNKLMAKLDKNKGSAMTPGTHQAILPEELLKKSALGDFHSYLVPFRFDNNTLTFLEKSVLIAKDLSVPSAAIWVRVSIPYFEHFKNKQVDIGEGKTGTVYDAWLPTILEYHKEAEIPFWNMNDDTSYKCNAFSDAGHMSPSCYHDYTDYMMTHVIADYSLVKGVRKNSTRF